MNIDERAQMLMALKAPNTSGIDPKSMVQALAGGYKQPQIFAYGMTPEQVRQEADAVNQIQQAQLNNALQGASMALSQDQQLAQRAQQAYQQASDEYYKKGQLGLQQQRLALDREQAMKNWEMQDFNKIMQYQNYLLQDRQVQLAEEAAGIENRYKQALASKNEYEAEKAKSEASMLTMKTDALKAASDTMVDVQLSGSPTPVKIPILTYLAIGGKPAKSATATEQKFNAKTNFFVQKGIPDVEAQFLATVDFANIHKNISTAVEKEMARISDMGGSFGQISTGTDINGNPTVREMTEQEYMQKRYAESIQQIFPMLSDETKQLLIKNPGLVIGGDTSQDTTAISDEMVQMFMNSLAQ